VICPQILTRGKPALKAKRDEAGKQKRMIKFGKKWALEDHENEPKNPRLSWKRYLYQRVLL
jgi:hypothetical protein